MLIITETVIPAPAPMSTIVISELDCIKSCGDDGGVDGEGVDGGDNGSGGDDGGDNGGGEGGDGLR